MSYLSHRKIQQEHKLAVAMSEVVIKTISREFDVPADFSKGRYLEDKMIEEVIIYSPMNNRYIRRQNTWHEYDGKSGYGAARTVCTSVDIETVRVGEHECLWGYDPKGKLHVDYSDSGRELSAKQIYSRNVYRNQYTYHWIKPYYTGESTESWHTFDPGPEPLKDIVEEWEV